MELGLGVALFEWFLCGCCLWYFKKRVMVWRWVRVVRLGGGCVCDVGAFGVIML